MDTMRPLRRATAVAVLGALAVASQPTVILTTSLFEAYTRDVTLGRAAALRTAQAKLQGDQATSHPAFWAPFVLVGDGG